MICNFYNEEQNPHSRDLNLYFNKYGYIPLINHQLNKYIKLTGEKAKKYIYCASCRPKEQNPKNYCGLNLMSFGWCKTNCSKYYDFHKEIEFGEMLTPEIDEQFTREANTIINE